MLIACGGCRKKLDVDEKVAGELARCPACNAVIKIPKAEEAAGRAPGEPPPIAAVLPDPEIETLTAAADQSDGGSLAPDLTAPTAEQARSLEGVETDDNGYVLAVPVSEDDAVQAPQGPTEIPGDGVGIERPKGGEQDLEYSLAQEEEPPARQPDSSAEPVPAGGDRADSLEDVLDRLDAEETHDTGASPIAPAGGPTVPDDKIVTRCPGCKGLLAIEAQFAGKTRTCPKCATEVRVPLKSTVVVPEAASAPPSPAPDAYQTPPSALAEDLAEEVDLKTYVVEPGAGSGRVVASYWVILAFVVGATVGFAIGWVLWGMNPRPSPPAIDRSPPAEVDQTQ